MNFIENISVVIKKHILLYIASLVPYFFLAECYSLWGLLVPIVIWVSVLLGMIKFLGVKKINSWSVVVSFLVFLFPYMPLLLTFVAFYF